MKSLRCFYSDSGLWWQNSELRRQISVLEQDLRLKEWQVMSTHSKSSNNGFICVLSRQMRSVARGIREGESLSIRAAALSALSDATLSGYLKKKGGAAFLLLAALSMRWLNRTACSEGRFDVFRQRWFELDGNMLTWWEKKESKTPRGTIDMLDEVADMYFNQVTSNARNTLFDCCHTAVDSTNKCPE